MNQYDVWEIDPTDEDGVFRTLVGKPVKFGDEVVGQVVSVEMNHGHVDATLRMGPNAVLPMQEVSVSLGPFSRGKPAPKLSASPMNWKTRQSFMRPDGEGCRRNRTCLRDADHAGDCTLYVAPKPRSYSEPREPKLRPRRPHEHWYSQDQLKEARRQEEVERQRQYDESPAGLSDAAHRRVSEVRERGEEYPGELHDAGMIQSGPCAWHIDDDKDYDDSGPM